MVENRCQGHHGSVVAAQPLLKDRLVLCAVLDAVRRGFPMDHGKMPAKSMTSAIQSVALAGGSATLGSCSIQMEMSLTS